MRGRIGSRHGYGVRVRAAEAYFYRLAHTNGPACWEPEHELLLAVLLQAIHDLPDSTHVSYEEPRWWLRSNHCRHLVEAIGIDHTYLIETLESVGLFDRPEPPPATKALFIQNSNNTHG